MTLVPPKCPSQSRRLWRHETSENWQTHHSPKIQNKNPVHPVQALVFTGVL